MRRAGLLLVVLVAAGCGSSRSAAVSVTPAATLADEPVHIAVSGLRPHELVTITLASADAADVTWRADARFRASAAGRIETDRTAPVAGSYSGVWGAGLLATMQPANGLHVYDWHGGARTFTVRVRAKGAVVGEARFQRRTAPFAVAAASATVAKNGFLGFFAAPKAARRHGAVLLFGGSEGGLATGGIAYALAARGYPALAVAYFAGTGLPNGLYHIKLEYFVRALQWLDKRPEVDPAHVVVLGISRGSEAAQLLGADYPDLVHGVVASVPSNTANWSGWEVHGRPVPTQAPGTDENPRAIIPVERIRGPVFAVCGGLDVVWPSCAYAKLIMRRLQAHRHPYRDVLVQEPSAGHPVGVLVPFALSSAAPSPGDERGRENAWPRLLTWLKAVTR